MVHSSEEIGYILALKKGKGGGDLSSLCAGFFTIPIYDRLFLEASISLSFVSLSIYSIPPKFEPPPLEVPSTSTWAKSIYQMCFCKELELPVSQSLMIKGIRKYARLCINVHIVVSSLSVLLLLCLQSCVCVFL